MQCQGLVSGRKEGKRKERREGGTSYHTLYISMLKHRNRLKLELLPSSYMHRKVTSCRVEKVEGCGGFVVVRLVEVIFVW